MSRVPRDFSLRPKSEQDWFLRETWCENCSLADLGIDEVCEYKENGEVFIEGKCCKCRSIVRSKIIDQSNQS